LPRFFSGSRPVSTVRWPVLTREEKNILLFVVIVFLLGLAVKLYREWHPNAVPIKKARAAVEGRAALRPSCYEFKICA
jgi:hypothetical protein